eukprot:1186909-Prorocentrum_minimum.AAC.2
MFPTPPSYFGRLPGAISLRSDGPEIRPGVGARPGNVKERYTQYMYQRFDNQLKIFTVGRPPVVDGLGKKPSLLRNPPSPP